MYNKTEMSTFIVVSPCFTPIFQNRGVLILDMLYLQYKQTSQRKPKEKSTQVTDFIFFS